MQANLENKKVLLTGASGGIGKALSQKFINNGANLIFTSSNNDKLDELRNLYGDVHSYYLLDLSKKENLMDNIIIVQMCVEYDLPHTTSYTRKKYNTNKQKN